MAVLIELRAENFKRLKAVELKPSQKGIQVIAGRNSQGKSSVLDAIIAALCGKSAFDQVPVRVGEDEATIEAIINTVPPLKIVRRISSEGLSTLTITQMGEYESKLARPQQTLDSLVGKVAFDPLAFTRMRAAEQVTLLKELVGVDTQQIDNEIRGAIEERKYTNRLVDSIQNQVDGMVSYPEVEPVDVSSLMAELESAEKNNTEIVKFEDAIESYEWGIETIQKEVSDLEAKLEKAKKQLAEHQKQLEESRKQLASHERIDTAQIKAKIASSQEVNRKAKANSDKAWIVKSLQEKKAAAESATKQIEALRAKRIALMGSAKWPVPGLGFGADGITFNGLPFSQCSSAEQLKISTAVGLSQNPTIRLMLIKDGSLLDDESLKVLHDMAVAHDAQIILERVGTGMPGEIVIEDGSVQ